LVADAGSTATIVYAFHAINDTGGETRVRIHNLGKGPALTSFEDKPSEAAAAIRTQLDIASDMVPESLQASVELLVLGTGEMRLMDPHKRTLIYQGLEKGIVDDGYPFDSNGVMARTLTGREEGVCAFLAANFLSERINADLEVLKADLMGVLDLGESSTQIALPPKVGVGENLIWNTDESHMHVQSYMEYGLEAMRQTTYKRLRKYKNHFVPNPCAFVGDKDPDDMWHGTGDAVACQTMVTEVLRWERQDCQEHKEDCLPMQPPKTAQDEDQEPSRPEIWHTLQDLINAETPRFFLISGYFSVVDFAHWWLVERPGARPISSGAAADADYDYWMLANASFATPSIAELKAAASILCAESLKNITDAVRLSQHRLTPDDKVPYRCFELNFIISLLSVGYGFAESARPFHFVEKLDGSDVEWNLGAFLLGRAQTGDTNSTDNIPSETSEAVTSWFWTDCVVGCLALAACGLLVRRWNMDESPGWFGTGDSEMEKMA